MANLKILTLSTLYPNACQPRHGIFVENRLRHLLATGQVESKVVAPVPWFPLQHKRLGDYSMYAKVPFQEQRYGIHISHPRYLVIPKIGMTVAPLLLYVSILREAKRILASGYNFDLVDAHYFYPDGVSAAMLARRLKKPLAITARGTDINLIPKFRWPRQQIIHAASTANGIITVCEALRTRLLELGVDGSKIVALRNGVDLQMFTPPTDRSALKKSLSIQDPSILSVGHLIERKGHHIVIEALAHLPDHHLYIAGDGPERNALQKLTHDMALEARVHFLGEIPHNCLKDYYGAVDAMILASSREGWANVLLESMACGTPVVATAVWGTAEVVRSPQAGILCKERNATMIAQSVRQLFANYPDRPKTRSYAEGFDWEETTVGQLELFTKILQR